MAATLTALLCLAPLAVRAEAKDTKDAAAAKKAIDAVNAQFSTAVQKHDAKALASHYTEDAIALPPGHAMVQGRSAIEGFWKDSIDGGLTDLTLKTMSVERSGDLAVETGTATLRLEPEGKEAQTLEGKYVVVWKHEKGGWMLHRDIWNMTPPEKQAK